MRVVFFLCVLCAVALGGAGTAAGAPRLLEAPIAAVTVHPGGIASVERVATVDLEAGEHELLIEGLSADAVSGSLRVAVEPAGRVTVGTVQLARQPVGEATRQREAELRARLAELERERATASDRKAAAGTRLEFIEGLAQLPAREGAVAPLAGEDAAQRWPELWRTIDEGALEARRAMRAAERRVADLDAEIEAVRRRLEALGEGARETVRIAAAVAAEPAVRAQVRFTYRVRGPQWEARYEARLDTRAGAVELVRTARVRQATGVDWTGIRLALATAAPIRGDVPRLQPWWVDLAPPARPAADASMEASELGTVRRSGGAPPPAETTRPEFAATYRLSGPVSVPGDNQPRTVRIDSTRLPADLAARVVPQRDERAWLTAAATWSGAALLPPGPMDRYRDGAFIGGTRLEAWAPGERRTLAFGVDPRLEVAFRRLEDEAGEAGLVSRRTTRSRRYRLRLVNRHERPVAVDVRFRVPVARDESITVEPWFPEPPGRSGVDDRQGVHEWSVDLDPGARHSIELGYRVSWPRDRRVPGF